MTTPTTRQELEALLDAGKLQAAMVNGRFWDMRRNGKTKLWKRDPDRFRIPFKCGFRTCGALDEHSLRHFDDFYRVKPE